MSDYNNLKTSISDGVLTITINRESKLNALNLETLQELQSAVQSIYDNPEIKGAIITGSGSKAFVAGADISEIAELDAENAAAFAANGQRIFKLIELCPKPVIAAVNGFALGGGCELAMACHLRVAITSAKFGQPEVNLGIIPGYGGTQRLPQLIGKARALELMMTADIISAKQALDYGLVNYLAETADDMMGKCQEILAKISAKAPVAIGLITQCVDALYDPEQNGYEVEAKSFGLCSSTEDFKEGTAAFMEKRQGKFKGR